MNTQPQERDILERLREDFPEQFKDEQPAQVIFEYEWERHEAAYEITRLRTQPSPREVALEKALRSLVAKLDECDFSVEDVHVIARALLSREAERDAMRREIDDLREFIRGVGVNCLRAAGQPSADGGKEGK